MQKTSTQIVIWASRALEDTLVVYLGELLSPWCNPLKMRVKAKCFVALSLGKDLGKP